MNKIAKLGIAVAGIAAVGYLAYKGLKSMIEDSCLDGWSDYFAGYNEDFCRDHDNNCDCGCHEHGEYHCHEDVNADDVKAEATDAVVDEKPAEVHVDVANGE